MTETIFDKILQKKIPAEIVFENEHVLAFNDVNPQSPIHVLVIPKKKMRSVVDLEKENLENIGLLFKSIALVDRKLNLVDSGYRVVLNHGKNGQQTVDYIHAHILGGRQLQWPPG